MDKRFLRLFLLISLAVFCFTGTIHGAGNSLVKVEVQLKSIECIQNNHVGNEWVFGSTVNKKELAEGESIELSQAPTGKLTIISEAEEEDSIPDYGSKTLTIPVSKLKANKAAIYTSNVTVTENRGRYSGNTAVWKFTYTVERK